MHPDADELYAVPLTEFIATRDALAKRLRGDGDKDAAAAVKKMRKPAVAAWVANQLARTHKPDVSRLLDATAALRDAQRVAVHEGDPAPLRETTRSHRSALDALEQAAKSVLRGAGMNASGTILERVRDTIQAAAADDPDTFAAGQLVDEGRPSGFGLDALGDLPTPERRSGPRQTAQPDVDESEPDESGTRSDAEARAEARQRASEARRAAQAAAKAADAAERDAERLGARATEAERVAREARARADEADAEAVRLRQLADAAAAELERVS